MQYQTIFVFSNIRERHYGEISWLIPLWRISTDSGWHLHTMAFQWCISANHLIYIYCTGWPSRNNFRSYLLGTYTTPYCHAKGETENQFSEQNIQTRRHIDWYASVTNPDQSSSTITTHCTLYWQKKKSKKYDALPGDHATSKRLASSWRAKVWLCLQNPLTIWKSPRPRCVPCNGYSNEQLWKVLRWSKTERGGRRSYRLHKNNCRHSVPPFLTLHKAVFNKLCERHHPASIFTFPRILELIPWRSLNGHNSSPRHIWKE